MPRKKSKKKGGLFSRKEEEPQVDMVEEEVASDEKIDLPEAVIEAGEALAEAVAEVRGDAPAADAPAVEEPAPSPEDTAIIEPPAAAPEAPIADAVIEQPAPPVAEESAVEAPPIEEPAATEEPAPDAPLPAEIMTSKRPDDIEAQIFAKQAKDAAERKAERALKFADKGKASLPKEVIAARELLKQGKFDEVIELLNPLVNCRACDQNLHAMAVWKDAKTAKKNSLSK